MAEGDPRLDVRDCPVVEELGTDDPNNVFTCKKAEECCTVDLEPACCASQDIGIAIQQQLSLWCPLLGIILILALFIWFCRTDEACCDVEKPCLYRCGCKKYRKDDDEGNSESKDEDTKSVLTTVVDDDDNTEQQVEQNANDLEEKLEPENENDTIAAADDTPKDEEEKVTDEVQENPAEEATPPAEE